MSRKEKNEDFDNIDQYLFKLANKNSKVPKDLDIKIQKTINKLFKNKP